MARGVNKCERCRCPKCRHPESRVVATNDMPDGMVVRKRKCVACGGLWFTAQEPEYVVPADAVAYRERRLVLLNDA